MTRARYDLVDILRSWIGLSIQEPPPIITRSLHEVLTDLASGEQLPDEAPGAYNDAINAAIDRGLAYYSTGGMGDAPCYIAISRLGRKALAKSRVL